MIINLHHSFSCILSALFLLSFLIFSSHPASSQSDTLSLNSGSGLTWEFRKAGDSIWHQATVPGTIHTDLLSNELIPDPFFRDNEAKVRWVENEDWEYQTWFNCSESFLQNKHLELILDGLDTYADVYLNEQTVLRANNMFRKWNIDVKKFLQPGNNHLLIHFHSAIKKGAELAAQLPYSIAGDIDGKVFTRKAQYQYGWDFGPRLVTCGIWKPVNLIAWNHFIIRDINVETTFQSMDSVSVMAKIIYDGSLQIITDSSREGIALNLTGPGAIHFLYQKQDTAFKTITCHFKIIHPALWWCNELGEQPIYLLEINRLYPQGNAVGIELLNEVSFAVRKLELIQQNDSAGKSFYFKLNGIPVFMKGANYIPPDNFLPRVTKGDYRNIIDDAVASHMNMLRVWGGGVYADDEFYNLCDQGGILVWQDFMFAGAMVPGDSGFTENVKLEVIDNISRLRNHPCIALWCGNNEIDEAWHNWNWQKQYHYNADTEKKLWNDYQKIFHESLPAIVHQYDPQRFYWPSSPSIGWGHKESLEQGDSHYWGVWWGEKPFNNYNKKVGRFVTEYGFQGMPSMSSIEEFTLPDDRRLNHQSKNKFYGVMNAHEKNATGFEKIDKDLGCEYPQPKDFESYVYVSQLLQRDAMRVAIEAHRSKKPYCMGTLYWQLNDCWPAVSWSSRDYYGSWKAFQYEVVKLYSTFLITIKEEKQLIHVYVVSDSLQPINAKLTVMLIDFSGKKLLLQDSMVNIEANSNDLVLRVNKKSFPKSFDPETSVLTIHLSVGERVLAEKDCYFEKPKDLMLPPVTISSKTKYISNHSSKPGFPFEYQIDLSSDKFAKDIFIEFEYEDVRFNDNFFHLVPGEKRVITMYSKQAIDQLNMPLKIRSEVDCY